MNWEVMAGQLGWGMMEDEGWRKGPWTSEEDRLLIEYVRLHGEGRWNSVARLAGNNSALLNILLSNLLILPQNSVTFAFLPSNYILYGHGKKVTGSQLYTPVNDVNFFFIKFMWLNKY